MCIPGNTSDLCDISRYITWKLCITRLANKRNTKIQDYLNNTLETLINMGFINGKTKRKLSTLPEYGWKWTWAKTSSELNQKVRVVNGSLRGTDNSGKALNLLETSCVLNYIFFSVLDWRVFKNERKSQSFVWALSKIAMILILYSSDVNSIAPVVL